jgi:molecular chaperone GrpE
MIDEEDKSQAAGTDAANDDAGEAGGSAAAQPSADEQMLTLEAELSDVKDRLLRALAETENTRRRAQREREDMQKYAITGFARDLLSPVDNLRRALESMPEAEITDSRLRSLLDGVAATERELLGALERHGVKRIDPKGEKFDHNFHQAIFEAPNPDKPAGTIVEVLQPGYVLHDRLLRPAMVGVAKGGPAAAPSEGTDDAA